MTAKRTTWTYYDGRWQEGDVRILGAASHATWLGSLVFDGARHFEGVSPDLDLHCARINASARALGLELDATGFGMGHRSQRYSMLIKDGVVTELNVEQGGEFKVSSAEHLLTQLS